MLPGPMSTWFDRAAVRAGKLQNRKRGEALLLLLRTTENMLARLDEYLDGGETEPFAAAASKHSKAVRDAQSGLRQLTSDERIAEAFVRLTNKSGRLVWVPDLVRESRVPTEDVWRWLTEQRKRLVVDLRPESGVNRISAADVALCPKNSDGIPLSNALLRVN